MRDCVFLVADSAMRAVFASFLGRERCCDTLGTGPFRFEAEQDLVVAPGNDPGVYRRAHEFLKGHPRTHRYAVIALDRDFGHHMVPGEVVSRIEVNLRQSGWADGQFAVVLIQPELEAWIWQDNPNVDAVFFGRFRRERRQCPASLRTWLRDQGLWPEGHGKPPDPKAAALRAIEKFRAGPTPFLYAEICRKVSVAGCQDPAFRGLRDVLRRWFPAPDVCP